MRICLRSCLLLAVTSYVNTLPVDSDLSSDPGSGVSYPDASTNLLAPASIPKTAGTLFNPSDRISSWSNGDTSIGPFSLAFSDTTNPASLSDASTLDTNPVASTNNVDESIPLSDTPPLLISGAPAAASHYLARPSLPVEPWPCGEMREDEGKDLAQACCMKPDECVWYRRDHPWCQTGGAKSCCEHITWESVGINCRKANQRKPKFRPVESLKDTFNKLLDTEQTIQENVGGFIDHIPKGVPDP